MTAPREPCEQPGLKENHGMVELSSRGSAYSPALFLLSSSEACGGSWPSGPHLSCPVACRWPVQEHFPSRYGCCMRVVSLGTVGCCLGPHGSGRGFGSSAQALLLPPAPPVPHPPGAPGSSLQCCHHPAKRHPVRLLTFSLYWYKSLKPKLYQNQRGLVSQQMAQNGHTRVIS